VGVEMFIEGEAELAHVISETENKMEPDSGEQKLESIDNAVMKETAKNDEINEPKERKLSSGTGVRLNRQSSKNVNHLVTMLREYDNMKTEEEFAISLFSCEICFMDKTGSQCLRFAGCNHVYCKECMTSYFTEKISVGAVSSLSCPTMKCDSQALPNQVAELVEDALYKKYEQLLLETQLESMTDVITCPRLMCQCPTMIDRETNLGQCPACHLAFCIYCKATYHGVSPCKFKTKEQRSILDKYNGAGQEERAFLEKRYGARQLATMAATLASEDYLSENARHCPHCNAPIEKNEGCNKITCWRCSTHFCWLCGEKLNQGNPYLHFNVMGGNCFGALFQGVDPLAQEPEEDFFADDDGDNWEIFAGI
jgi:E3 ubiquitin-protein ligase RNF14